MIDFDTVFIRKFMAFAKQTNLYLNHFPKSEKYALSQSIREDMYKIFDLMVEGQKRYYKKTSRYTKSIVGADRVARLIEVSKEEYLSNKAYK